ncbi:hypothetical protein MKZ38_008919 [Zalerion maritima]|uniref:Uncharacterized protein n=1 Tax=Zalerion maritima TaxID=339359 RepID=A0AAD5WMI1_9PEZI|nr:hypothetical protein MKZ38_008919 [Zalerion maritima]
MGNISSHVSIEGCKAYYNVSLDCSITDYPRSYGGLTKGTLQGDPDIAGIGIVSVFIAVSGFALVTALIAVIWQTIKCYRKSIWSFTEEREKDHTSVSEILETLVLSCSDQQLFTGAAYALAVRYWRGCTLSAYHYNVVANGLLITLATHLLAITVVLHYWKYPFLATIRAAVTFGVFWAAGLMMAKRHTQVGAEHGDESFPIKIPGADAPDDKMFLAAGCFQRKSHDDKFNEAWSASLQSTGAAFGMENQGWNLWFLMMVWWSVAIAAEVLRWIRRGQGKRGLRRNLIHRTKTWADQTGPEAPTAKFSIKKVNWRLVGSVFFKIAFLLYLYAGLGISAVVVISSGTYIRDLRSWVHDTHWLENDPSGHDEEQDANSLGQLIPIFLSSLTVFAFLQAVNEKVSRHRKRKHAREERREGDEEKESGYAYADDQQHLLKDPECGSRKGGNKGYLPWAGEPPAYQSTATSPQNPRLPPRPAPARTWAEPSSISSRATNTHARHGTSSPGTWPHPAASGAQGPGNSSVGSRWDYSPLNFG